MTAGDMKRMMVAWRRHHREFVKLRWTKKARPRYPKGHLIFMIAGVWVFWANHVEVEYNGSLQSKEYARCSCDGHRLALPGFAIIW